MFHSSYHHHFGGMFITVSPNSTSFRKFQSLPSLANIESQKFYPSFFIVFSWFYPFYPFLSISISSFLVWCPATLRPRRRRRAGASLLRAARGAAPWRGAQAPGALQAAVEIQDPLWRLGSQNDATLRCHGETKWNPRRNLGTLMFFWDVVERCWKLIEVE